MARRLGSHRRIVCAAPAYIERHGAPKTPADLTHHNCLLFDGPDGLNPWPFRMASGRPDSVPVTGNFPTNNGDSTILRLLDVVGLYHAAEFSLGARTTVVWANMV